MVWSCPGVVTTSCCPPTPLAQHQASGPHVGSLPHRLNSSGSVEAPPQTLHIVPPMSHLLAVRGPLAAIVTAHCLTQHDFIRHRARATQDLVATTSTSRESLIRRLQEMSEITCLLYLDFDEVLSHGTVSHSVRCRGVVMAVTQDQDDVLSRHQFAAVPCFEIKISLRGGLLCGSIPSMSAT